MNELIPCVELPEIKSDNWEVKKFEVKETFSQIISMLKTSRGVPPGIYTKLLKNGSIIMSDTPDEKRDHIRFVRYATGNILIAGLGLGMVLNACALKKDVNHITVVEISQELIDLVAPFYIDKYKSKLTILNDDILTIKFEKGKYFDCAWYDIWADICIDNYEDMKKLHRRFGRITGWQGSWSRNIVEYKLKEEKRRSKYFW